MKRRWEVWALNTENGEPIEDCVARCRTKLGARFRRHVAETDLLTLKMLSYWNEIHPRRQLGLHPRYEIRRAA